MSFCKVLLIEKSRRGSTSFAAGLRRKGYIVEQTHDVSGAIRIFQKSPYDIVVLDAASMQTSGIRLASRLRDQINNTPLILVAPDKSTLSPNGVVDEILIQPLTARKLSNRIKRLAPGKDGDVISIGPIHFDAALRRVRYKDRTTRITPRCAVTLKLFIERAGRLVRREEIMKRIWHTDYMGDTRTLDVHISWIRKAIEPDPSNPSYLKTIRGVGFRLDIPQN
jgi:DNA-binding response OmpR family regulator